MCGHAGYVGKAQVLKGIQPTWAGRSAHEAQQHMRRACTGGLYELPAAWEPLTLRMHVQP